VGKKRSIRSAACSQLDVRPSITRLSKRHLRIPSNPFALLALAVRARVGAEQLHHDARQFPIDAAQRKRIPSHLPAKLKISAHNISNHQYPTLDCINPLLG